MGVGAAGNLGNSSLCQKTRNVGMKPCVCAHASRLWRPIAPIGAPNSMLPTRLITPSAFSSRSSMPGRRRTGWSK